MAEAVANAAAACWCRGDVREAEKAMEIRANPGSLRKPEIIVLFLPPLPKGVITYL
jgi:hypothetical protein